eukprot:TRINITY_DN32931_c0_g1_i1.p1 TRINITY_DN32931_c0_g1~~TRINITY_DN32931_c0_g1_i1.p1  ORF type:complete len:187 (+),score=90.66 TRINITY_DN32931_c0_g1_i1:56-616(+)
MAEGGGGGEAAKPSAAAPKKAGKQGKQFSTSRLQMELTEEQESDILEAFNLLDSEGYGTIDARDLKVALRALGYEPQKDKMKKIISEYDKDSMTGTLLYNDFRKIMTEKLFDYENEEEIEIAFPLFTEGKDNFITFDDLKRVGAELGESLTDEVYMEMIREADVIDHDGKISKDEFHRVMKRENAY